MQKTKKYEKILELVERNPTISIDVLRKKLPEISSGTFYQTMNVLSKHNLVKKIPRDKRSVTYQRTNEYTTEKGKEILKSYFQGREELAPKEPISEKEEMLFKPVTPEELEAISQQGNSWCDVAYQILKAANKPLGPTELTTRILSAGLVKSRSKSPVNTVYTCIFQDMKTKGARSRFMKFGKKFGIVEWADKYLGDSFQTELQTDIQARYWRQFGFKEIPEKELLASIRKEIQEIRSFISGEAASEPSPEKLCFWVWFCYQFGLFWEGSIVFRRINTLSVPPPLYQIIKKMGIICENRRE
jgi:DNA-binding PadR family transcriptional regulator